MTPAARPAPAPSANADAGRWAAAILVIFALMGIGFGSWLGRLPAVRDHLGATTLQMSVFGLVLALGSLTGLILSGRTVTRLGPARALAIGACVQALAITGGATLLWLQLPIAGCALLALYGFSFATSDVAMNVSGANVERALGKTRMPLFHAGYSLGSVGAMGLGALAEVLGIPVPLHLAAVFALIVAGILIAIRAVPGADPRAAESEPPSSVHTGPIELPRDESRHTTTASATTHRASAPQPQRNYTPWRDPRILIIGLIAMSMSLAEGTASDWLPLALADGRDFTNQAATLTLGVFFVSMTLTRLAGSWLLPRLGRVAVLRAGGVLVIAAVALTILVPAGWAAVLGAVLWGVGCAYGFPVGISAAADNPRTAIRDVAAVSAIAYTAFLLGPMLIGFIGEQLGLLNAFWPLVAFAALTLVFAGTAREPASRETDDASTPPR